MRSFIKASNKLRYAKAPIFSWAIIHDWNGVVNKVSADEIAAQ
ncbi:MULTISPECIES: hypothetical protein [Bacteroides]|nr:MULTISPECIES: hypothetical protein [Bacteroides]